ncbi:MAG: hypothetical protein HY043_20815 [Verrucomicrobia bacterium]|nr:hypothetical protein [Verrucomicrobiota bacterium]
MNFIASYLFVAVWMILLVTSIAWYGFLVFYIGFKGGKEILEMMRSLDRRNQAAGEEEKTRS